MSIRTTTLAVAALGLCVSGCSAPGTQAGNAGNPNAPSHAIIINVVAIKGSQSFSPNPANIPSGQMVAWHNIDSVTHRVALFDRSIDTGNLEPGAFSAPMILRAIGEYRCTIHPEMVGTLMR
jgi:plastocyanin